MPSLRKNGSWVSNVLRLGVILSVLVVAESELMQRFAGSLFPFIGDTIRQSVSLMPARSKPVEPLVVLMSDQGDQKISDEWPLPWSSYEQFITRSWCLGAKAVFVDISFLQSRNRQDQDPQLKSLANLARVLSTEPEQSAKFASLWQEACALPGVEQRSRGVTGRARNRMPVFFAQPVGDIQAPLWQDLRPFVVSTQIEEENLYPPVGNSGLRTAAFAARDALCSNSLVSQKICRRELSDVENIEVQDTAYTPVSEANFRLPHAGEPSCIYRGPGLPTHLPIWTIGSYVSGPQRSWGNCPPVLTLTWQRALGASGMATLENAFDGRVVLLAASLQATADPFQTSLHRDLPGAYLHALAIEQVLSENAIPSTPVAAWQRVAALLLPIWITLGLSLFMRRRSAGKPATVGKRTRHWLPVIAGLAMVVLIYTLEGWPAELKIRDGLFFALGGNIEAGFLDPLAFIGRELARLRDVLMKEFGFR